MRMCGGRLAALTLAAAIVAEANDTPGTAPELHDSTTRGDGKFGPYSITAGDVDYFFLDTSLSPGQTLEVEVVYAIGKADLHVEVLGPDGSTRLSEDPAGVPEDPLFFSRALSPLGAIPDDVIYFRVSGATGADVESYTLIVRIEDP